MTKPLDFLTLAKKLGDFVCDYYEPEVPDFRVMEELHLTPSMWKVWKPKFIEKFGIDLLNKLDTKTGKSTAVRINYDKKQKMWSSFVEPEEV